MSEQRDFNPAGNKKAFAGRVLCLLAVLGCLALVSPGESRALFGAPAVRAVREAVEAAARKFSVNLSSSAGKRFAREAGEFAARHGDDGISALKKVGPEAISLARTHGDDAVALLARHPEAEARFLAMNMDEALWACRKFGENGARMLARHPGSAKPLLEAFGQNALRLPEKLGDRGLHRLSVLSGKMATQKERDRLLENALMWGDGLVEILWKHKWKLGAAGAFYALVSDFESGQEGRTGNSLLQNLFGRAWDAALKASPWVPVSLLVLVIFLAWPLIRLARKISAGAANSLERVLGQKKDPPAENNFEFPI